MIGSVKEGLEVYKETLKDYLVWARDQGEESQSWGVGSEEAMFYGKENTRRLLELGTMAEILKLSGKEKVRIEKEVKKEIKTSKSKKK
jgi:hypothetical protein